jgi:hypothetical protein
MTKRKLVYTVTISIIGVLTMLSVMACQSEEEKVEEKTAEPTEKTMTDLVFFSSDDFAGSGNCAECHSNLKDSEGNDVSIDSHWRSSMMANAAKDPLWQAKVASEVSRTPVLKEIIEDKCSSCHMPMAYTQANTDGLSTQIMDDGFLNPSNSLHNVAMDGNSCTLCHQIIDPVLGKYQIDTSSNPPNRLIYGPFVKPQKLAMKTAVGFQPEFSEHVSESVLCGTCH